jgi:hypothetical protein
MRNYITRKNILIVAGAILSLMILYIAYDNLHFHVKSTSPDVNSVATSTIELQYHFSQPVKAVESVVINDTDVTSSVTINNKTINIPLSDLDSETTYSVTLKAVQSEWFNAKINSTTDSFVPKYIDFKDLPDEQQQRQISASNSGQVDDPFVSDNVFPIFNQRWQIEATVIPSDRTTVLTVKFFSEVPDYDNGGAVTQVSNDTAEQYRNEVLAEIKERGGDPDDYRIIYQTNKYLYEKYSTQSHYHEES